MVQFYIHTMKELLKDTSTETHYLSLLSAFVFGDDLMQSWLAQNSRDGPASASLGLELKVCTPHWPRSRLCYNLMGIPRLY